METVTIHPKDKEQLNTVEAVLKLLKVPFKKVKNESPYLFGDITKNDFFLPF